MHSSANGVPLTYPSCSSGVQSESGTMGRMVFGLAWSVANEACAGCCEVILTLDHVVSGHAPLNLHHHAPMRTVDIKASSSLSYIYTVHPIYTMNVSRLARHVPRWRLFQGQFSILNISLTSSLDEKHRHDLESNPKPKSKTLTVNLTNCLWRNKAQNICRWSIIIITENHFSIADASRRFFAISVR